MPKKKVFSKEAWIKDRGYTEEYADRFAFSSKSASDLQRKRLKKSTAYCCRA